MIRQFILLCLIILSVVANASIASISIKCNLAKYYQNVDGAYTAIPISGIPNVKVEVVDISLDQPIWTYSEEQYIENGSISMIISDPDIDWVKEVETKSLIFRISVLEDQVDIDLEFLPFSVYTEKANQFKQFNDFSISQIDYDNKRWVINESTLNAQLAVSGSIFADKIIGSGSGLFNLTGPGFNDGHSLNSEDTYYKDVLYVDVTGNVGIFTLLQMHG